MAKIGLYNADHELVEHKIALLAKTFIYNLDVYKVAITNLSTTIKTECYESKNIILKLLVDALKVDVKAVNKLKIKPTISFEYFNLKWVHVETHANYKYSISGIYKSTTDKQYPVQYDPATTKDCAWLCIQNQIGSDHETQFSFNRLRNLYSEL